MKRVKNIFSSYADPGHSWLKVPYSLLDTLGIITEITAYSYQRGEYVYLEEDADVNTFFKAYLSKYGNIPKVRCNWTNKRSKATTPTLIISPMAATNTIRHYNTIRLRAE